MFVAISGIIGQETHPSPGEKGPGSIAFASSRDGTWQIWLMKPDGANQRQLTHGKEDLHYPAWSPDGSQVALASTRSGKMEIWVMESSGANPRQITGLADAAGESLEPKWSR
jgi:TolB protein